MGLEMEGLVGTSEEGRMTCRADERGTYERLWIEKRHTPTLEMEKIENLNCLRAKQLRCSGPVCCVCLSDTR